MQLHTIHAIRVGQILLLLASWGCRDMSDGASTDPSGWPGQIRDSAGIAVVSNPMSGIWTEQTRWTAERDLVIGAGVSNVPEYEFGGIADVDAGADGRIYVLDNQAGQVSAFAPDGQYAFAFGRPGKGPGEFSIDAFAIRVDSDGTIAVRDGINQRDNIFSPDGTFLRVAPLGSPFKESAALPQGARVERATRDDWDGLLHVASDGSIIDTITVFDYDMTKRGGALSSVARGGSANAIVIPLLPALPSWAVAGDGRIIAGVSDEYRIEVRQPSGVLEMLIDKDHDTLVMDSEAGERMLNRLRELLRAAGLAEDAIAGVFERFSYSPPDSLPAFAGIVGGPAETIWVQQILPIDSMTANATLDALNPGSADWDVYCSDGRYLGQIALPQGFTLMRVREWLIYGIETDDLDVQRVVRLAVRPGTIELEDQHPC
jgi:hypothetical protein